MSQPKVLIISSDPFSYEAANGRTLGSFFVNYDPDKLAQFYCNDYPLDMIDCSYFQLSDGDLLYGLRHFKKVGKTRSYNSKSTTVGSYANPKNAHKKNPLTCLLRDFVWRMPKVKGKSLKSWMDSFHPEIVLVQVSDRPFEYDFARWVAKRYGAKIATYSSERYYFNVDNYMDPAAGHHSLYRSWHRKIVRSLKKLMAQSSLSIFIHDELKEMYEKEFSIEGKTLYTSASWVQKEPVQGQVRKFVYFGNTSLGRDDALIELAKTLSPSARLDVFGSATEDTLLKFKKAGVTYKGTLPYEELETLVDQYDVLVHAVPNTKENTVDNNTQFSTKIADCLATGKPFLVYAPSNLSLTKYLLNNDAAFVATNKSELKETIASLNDLEKRDEIRRNALLLAAANHSKNKNADQMTALLESL